MSKNNNKPKAPSDTAPQSSESAKRTKRAPTEKIAELEAKIAKAEESIEGYKAKIENIRHPKPRVGRVGAKAIMDKAKAMGMTPKEIAEKLGIEL